MHRLLVFAAILAMCGTFAYAAADHGYAGSMVTLDQGWPPQIAHRMWHETQGADLMPVAFIESLRDAHGGALMSPANLQRFGFIPDEKSPENPHGWPIGFTEDTGSGTDGIAQFGLTCTACHTGHLDYKGTRVLVEGAGATMQALPFVGTINAELVAAFRDPPRRAELLKSAVAGGYPQARAARDMAALVATIEKNAAVAQPIDKFTTPGGPGRVDALSGIVYNVMVKALDVPQNARRAIAPVNFPQLWDIWHFDWVQYNASVHQPMGRNVGEAIGLGAHLNITDASGAANPPSTRWKSSVRVRNLFWMENQIRNLHAPTWPSSVFGPIDEAKAARGRALFVQSCARCHGIAKIDGGDTWAVHTVSLARIGTDPNQATAFAKASYDARKLGLSEHQSGVVGLVKIVENVKRQAYVDEGIPHSQWSTYDGFGRKMLFSAPCGYKARPLIGIWATAPFLHNGTVPSVYDMLSDSRPSHPILGNTEFDPVKLGMVQQQTPFTMTIDTALPGNSNAGHWWTNDRSRPGRIGPALSDEQKYAIIEYLKIADYANYPTTTVKGHFAQPCADDPHWADASPLRLTP